MSRQRLERWLPVTGFPGYEVSDMGRVRSCRRRAEPRVLRGSVGLNGYVCISLRRDGQTFRRCAHALVLEAFVGPCPPGMEVRHFPSADRADNRLENLSYGTRAENARDRHVHGTMHLCKLTPEQVDEIRRTPPGTRGLARRLGVSKGAVRHARLGVTWKNRGEGKWLAHG